MDERIQNVGKVALDAFKELKKIQNGTSKLLKTGFVEFDTHIGGILPGDLLTIASKSGAGKSHKLYNMLDNILDLNVNKDAKDYVSLEYSFEMKMLNKIVRKSHSILGKKKSSVLKEAFSEEEQVKMKEYNKSLQDERRFVCQEPVSVDEFYKMTREFCKIHSDKKAVIISIDHLLLYTDGDKQKAVEKATDLVNKLKLEFKNTYFILISQTNRSNNLTLAKDRDNSITPNNSWLFASSFIEMVSSYIIIMVNPFKEGINEFLKFNPERYDYLSEHFTGVLDKNGKESFSTIGKNFIFVTKTRESDEPYKNLFIENMNFSDDVLSKMKQEAEERKSAIPTISIPELSFPTPTFDLTKTLDVYVDSKDAFGDDDIPF